MSLKITMFLLFCVSYTYTQNISGEIAYNISQNETFKNTLQKSGRNSTKSLVAGLSENLRTVELSLKFNNEASFYTLKKAPMKNDSESNMMQNFALNIAHTGNYSRFKDKRGIYYTPKSFYDAEFIVHYDDTPWKLISEEKKIGNYVCYKAVGERIVKNSKGSFNHTVNAWYCPEIPYSYGPARYGGLPGLILEVDDGEMVYKGTTIEISNNNKILFDDRKNLTNDTKIISEEEYQKLLMEKINGVKQMMSN